MSSIDNRVVKMTFDNSAFGKNVNSTIKQLDQLSKNMTMDNAKKGLEEVDKKIRGFNFHPMQSAVDGVTSRFSAMQVAGVTAIATIVHKGITAGADLAKSLTISPIKAGLEEYGTNLNSIQTILANTQQSGATLEDVNGALDELNEYSDKTIYNFSQMAKNIGTFTAAGVDLDTATGSIKGIANLAALSGSSAEQASGAMYQLSQAISSGRVSLQDWNSVVNAGMGGTVFQRALAQTAEKMGTLDKGAVKLSGKMKNATINGQSFRESITAKPGEESWLTSDVLTKTLQQFTGDMTDAQLKAQGFNAEQIKAIQLQAQTATEAATQVKTLGAVFDTARETATSGWAKTWQLIFGDFNEAKGLFTGISQGLNGMIDNFSDARNQVLQDWKDLGGRDVLIQGLTNAMDSLKTIIAPIRDAFRDIFPAKTGADLYALTVRFSEFMKSLAIGTERGDALRRTFRGVFSLFHIGIQLIKGILSFFGSLFGEIGKGSGDVLDFTGGIADMIVSLDNAITKGELFTNFFDKLAKVISAPIVAIQKLLGIISYAFGSKKQDEEFFSFDESTGAMDAFMATLNPFEAAVNGLSGAWDKLVASFTNTDTFLGKVVKGISDAINGIWPALQDSITSGNFDAFMQSLQTAFGAGIFLQLRKLFKSKFMVDASGGFLQNMKESLGQLSAGLKAMTLQIKAKAVFQIAAAVALLAASMYLLATLDPAALATGIGGISAAMTALMGGMALLAAVTKTAGFIKIPIMAASLILLSSALLILAVAIRVISELNWEEMARGLTGMIVMMVALVAMMKLLSGNKTDLIRVAVGVRALAIGINLMARGIQVMGQMSWEELAKGLTGMAGGLIAIAFAVRVIGKSLSTTKAVGLLLIAVAIRILANAMEAFAAMSWQDISKGIVSLGVALLAIAAAMHLMPKGMLLQAAALVAIGIAINEIALAMKLFATMSWEEIGKGLGTLAAMLLILAGALALMQGALIGAASLVIIATALGILTPQIVLLGALPWQVIALGLGALIAGIVALALTSTALSAFIPAMLALGSALLTLGAALALAGGGMLAFATAFGILGTTGVAGAVALTAIIKALIQILPDLFKGIGLALVELFKAIADALPQARKAVFRLLDMIFDTILRYIPKLGEVVYEFLSEILRVIVRLTPEVVATFISMIIAGLEGIRNNIYQVTTLVLEIITEFINGITDGLPEVLDAFVKLFVAAIQGVADALNNNAEGLGTAVENLVEAMRKVGIQVMEGLINGMLGFDFTGAVGGIVDGIIGGFKSGFGIFSPSRVMMQIGKYINEGLIQGVVDTKEKTLSTFENLREEIRSILDGAKEDVKQNREELKRLYAADKPDTKAIKKAEKALAASIELTKRARNANVLFTKGLAKQKAELARLAGEYEVVSERLEAANDALEEAIDERDSFFESIRDQYSDLPEIKIVPPKTEEVKESTDAINENSEALQGQIIYLNGATEATKEKAEADKDAAEETEEHTTTVDEYMQKIREITEANVKFRQTLDKLRDLGLDETTYRKFLEQGTETQPFLEELLSRGAGAIKDLSALDKALLDSAIGLGQDSSKELYQAGVNAAQSLVNALTSQLGKITSTMESIGTAMAKAIKKELGIKSPSRVFREIAEFTLAGLALGFKDTRAVDQAALDAGNSAIDKLKQTMAHVQEAMNAEIDMTPKIAPVIDLDTFRKQAATINGYLDPEKISASGAYNKALTLAKDAREAQDREAEIFELISGDNYVYNQNNYSPKALSTGEIYRQTKNQISIAKGAVG